MLSQSLPAGVYQTPDWIQWCVDARQVMVVDRSRGRSYTLRGVPAAVWSWFTLGYSRSRVAELVSIMQAQSFNAATGLVDSILCEWLTSQLLVEKSSQDHYSG